MKRPPQPKPHYAHATEAALFDRVSCACGEKAVQVRTGVGPTIGWCADHSPRGKKK